MRIVAIIMVSILMISINAQKTDKSAFVKEKMNIVANHYSEMLKELGRNPLPPRSALDGKIHTVNTGDWTSGFFVGSLWYLYEYTKDTFWLSSAKEYSKILEKEKFNRWTHDLGFMLYCSYGNG
jgi:unsaturated chondroitin disaccharide hydrolase